MKFDTSGIDVKELAQRLTAACGAPISSVAFVPKGEEALCYVARGADGSRYFVRVQERAGTARLERTYAATDALRSRCGIAQVLAPLRCRSGTFAWRYGRFSVVVFPFVEGSTAFEAGFNPEQHAEAAAVVSALHNSGGRCELPALARETFANPFDLPIRRALSLAASPPPAPTVWQDRASGLLLEQQADVQATLALMRRMGREARRLDPPLVPTHGDPNEANFLIGRDGSLRLTDWGELALGPRERDLTFFTGERFEPFLEWYLDGTHPVRLSRMLFAFCVYRWVVQEIADYATRILCGEPEPDEAEHAWLERVMNFRGVAWRHEPAAGGRRSGVRVVHDLPHLLRTPAGDGDLGRPLQRLLA
jgi:spectinomycin phosphotransferase